MVKSTRAFSMLVALLAVGFWGCSSDDKTGTGPGGNNNTTLGPDFSKVAISIPAPLQAAANANPGGGAAIAVSYITQVNAMAAFATYFTPPSVAPGPRPVRRPESFAAGANDSVTWTDGQVTVTVVTQIIEGSVTTFSVRLDGSEGGTTYSNFEYISGYFFPDGSEGDFNIYHPSSPTVPITRWAWSRDPSNALIMTYMEFTANTLITIGVNTDGSGSIGYSYSNHVQYAAVWASDGSGSWSFYDNQGNVTDSGTWQ